MFYNITFLFYSFTISKRLLQNIMECSDFKWFIAFKLGFKIWIEALFMKYLCWYWRGIRLFKSVCVRMEDACTLCTSESIKFRYSAYCTTENNTKYKFIKSIKLILWLQFQKFSLIYILTYTLIHLLIWIYTERNISIYLHICYSQLCNDIFSLLMNWITISVT